MIEKKLFLIGTLLLSILPSLFVGSLNFKNYSATTPKLISITPEDMEERYLSKLFSLLTPSFKSPVDSAQIRVSSPVGPRGVIIRGIGGDDGDFHRGIDLVAPRHTKVKAAASGRVSLHYPPPSKNWKGHPVFGGLIVLDHGRGIYTLYGHLGKSNVTEGQWIDCETVIGEIGNTGKSTGPHLHFEIIIDPSQLVTF